MDVAPETRREAAGIEPAPAAVPPAQGPQSGLATARPQTPALEGGDEQAAPAAGREAQVPGAAGGDAPGADAAAPAADPRRWWVLATCCIAACARLVDPKLWMMGLDIPDTAFGAGWQDYRLFSTVIALLLLACMLFGGLLGDFFGRRRVLLVGTVVSTVAGFLTLFAPSEPWFVATRSVDVAAGGWPSP